MVIAKQIAAEVNDMYLRTSIVFIVSITVLLSLVWSFFQFSNGLFGLYPEGQVPSPCSLSNGSGADDEIIFAVLYLFAIPLAVRIVRLTAKISVWEFGLVILIDLLFEMIWLASTCVYWSGTIFEAGNYFVLPILVLFALVNLIALFGLFSHLLRARHST